MTHRRLFSLIAVLMACFLLLAPLSPAAAQEAAPTPQLVKDINPQVSDSTAVYCVMKAMGKIFLIVNAGVNGVVLYSSDGTRMTADLNPGPGTSDPRLTSQEPIMRRMITSGQRLYLSATDGGRHPGSAGTELWMVDAFSGKIFLPLIAR